ncbi:MAG: hypothetical protein JWP97_1942, partial [Labilithrix sp.]|nr:hypothetical protein [Labilithrix sp.]
RGDRRAGGNRSDPCRIAVRGRGSGRRNSFGSLPDCRARAGVGLAQTRSDPCRLPCAGGSRARANSFGSLPVAVRGRGSGSRKHVRIPAGLPCAGGRRAGANSFGSLPVARAPVGLGPRANSFGSLPDCRARAGIGRARTRSDPCRLRVRRGLARLQSGRAPHPRNPAGIRTTLRPPHSPRTPAIRQGSERLSARRTTPAPPQFGRDPNDFPPPALPPHRHNSAGIRTTGAAPRTPPHRHNSAGIRTTGAAPPRVTPPGRRPGAARRPPPRSRARRGARPSPGPRRRPSPSCGGRARARRRRTP